MQGDDLAALLRRARSLVPEHGRRILGIAGPPGAGKSTIAQHLADALGAIAVLVPMDGFHLAQSELERLGRASRKGAPDTFDAPGYLALLDRLRRPTGDVVYAPVFRRDLEEPIAGAIAVTPEHRLVVTEGNYLLLDEPPFAGVASLLDESWYLELDDETRRSRLLARHLAFGRRRDGAEAFVYGSDEQNARRVATSKARADLVVLSPADIPIVPAARD